MAKKKERKPAEAAPAVRELTVPLGLAAAILLAFAVVCLYVEDGFSRVPWPAVAANLFLPIGDITPSALAANLLSLAEAAWLCAAFAGAGSFLLERLGLDSDDPWERWSLSFGLGFGAWGTAVLLLGLAGALYQPLLIALTLPCVVPLLKRRPAPAKPVTGFGPVGIAAAALFVFFLLLILPNLFAPETFYDSLLYHLALPQLYLQHHRIFATPYNLYAGIPSLPQMDFAAALAWDHWGVAARLIHFAIIPAVGAAFVAAARRWGKPDAGPLAAVIFLSAPVAFFEGGRVTVGAELALFQFASFYCFAVACAQEAPARRRWLILSGLFLGFAFSTKYTAWVLPAAFLLTLRRARPRELAVVFLVAAAVTAPWIARNVAFYRSPLYPYMAETFHSPNADTFQLDRARRESQGQDPVQILTSPAKLAAYARLPWDMSLHSGKSDVDYPGPMFLLLLPALFLVPLTEPVLLAALLALGAWLSLSLFTVLPRYFIPEFAVLAPPLAWAACALPRPLRSAVAAAVFLVAAANVLPLGARAAKSAVWPVVLGRRTRESFLAHGNEQGYVTPAYAGFKYLDENAPPGAKVLLFGDGRSFYLDRDSVGATVFNASPLEVWANAAADEAALRDKLAAEGISYILVNRGETLRNRDALAFTPRGRAVVDALWKKDLLKVFEVGSSGDRWVIVYRVLSADEAAKPHPAYDMFREPNFTPENRPPAGDD